jgi:hypothetical protein
MPVIQTDHLFLCCARHGSEGQDCPEHQPSEILHDKYLSDNGLDLDVHDYILLMPVDSSGQHHQ